MTEHTDNLKERAQSGEVSLLDIASTIIENIRWVLAGLALGAIGAVGFAISRELVYTSSVLLTTSGSGGAESQLTGLASQLGVNIAGTNRSGGINATPDMLVELGRSDVLFERLLNDTVTISEDSSPRPFLEVLTPDEGPLRGTPGTRERKLHAFAVLRKAIQLEKTKPNQLVSVRVTTSESLLSFRIAQAVVREFNGFLVDLGRAQAKEERQFVRGRLVARESLLQDAEDQLAAFLTRNREYRSSPRLAFEFEHLQRKVTFHQQVLIGLGQAEEQAAAREIRDIPVILVLEPPHIAVEAEPRGRLRLLQLGLLSGLLVGVVAALAVAAIGHLKGQGDPRWERFSTAVVGVLRRAGTVLDRK